MNLYKLNVELSVSVPNRASTTIVSLTACQNDARWLKLFGFSHCLIEAVQSLGGYKENLTKVMY